MSHEEFGRFTFERQQQREAAGIPPTENLLMLVTDIVSLLDTHPGHVRVYFEYGRELSPRYDREVRALRRRYHSMVEDVLRRGIASGEFRPVNVRLAVMAFFGMCNWTYQWYRPGGRLTTKQVAKALHHLFIRGIAAEVPARRGTGGRASVPE